MPLPEPGEVINFSYLGEREYRKGRDEGIKDRPVAVVLVRQMVDEITQLIVTPMTTKPACKDQVAIEVPQAARAQLGLSAERSWMIADEANRFAWPGYDLRPIKGKEPSISYGSGPSGLFSQFRDHGVAVGTGRVIVDCDELLGRVVGAGAWAKPVSSVGTCTPPAGPIAWASPWRRQGFLQADVVGDDGLEPPTSSV